MSMMRYEHLPLPLPMLREFLAVTSEPPAPPAVESRSAAASPSRYRQLRIPVRWAPEVAAEGDPPPWWKFLRATARPGVSRRKARETDQPPHVTPPTDVRPRTAGLIPPQEHIPFLDALAEALVAHVLTNFTGGPPSRSSRTAEGATFDPGSSGRRAETDGVRLARKKVR